MNIFPKSRAPPLPISSLVFLPLPNVTLGEGEDVVDGVGDENDQYNNSQSTATNTNTNTNTSTNQERTFTSKPLLSTNLPLILLTTQEEPFNLDSGNSEEFFTNREAFHDTSFFSNEMDSIPSKTSRQGQRSRQMYGKSNICSPGHIARVFSLQLGTFTSAIYVPKPILCLRANANHVVLGLEHEIVVYRSDFHPGNGSKTDFVPDLNRHSPAILSS